jgi:hypothetical protein
MRWSQFSFLAFVLLALTGCGTFQNLKNPPNGPLFFGTGCCYPFGGVTRSGLLAAVATASGLGEVVEGNIAVGNGEFGSGIQRTGNGIFMTSAGLVAFADTAVSLAGDIVTFPIAYARSKEYSWATWWGEKLIGNSSPFAPPTDDSNKKTDGGGEPSD